MFPGFPVLTDAYIVAGAGNRYEMGLWSRSPLVKTRVYQIATDLHLYSVLRPAPIPSTSLAMTQYLVIGTYTDVKASLDILATINPAP